MPFVFKDGSHVEITQQELAEIQYVPTSERETHVRRERDNLIAATDWWATSDRTMTAEQTAYRQALRDITGQAGFPTNITWPTKP
jgi:hypothetical protein